MIDGVWHCSNCGCPDPVAIGRRKGPLGDKSQCGACGKSKLASCCTIPNGGLGKYWHQYRKPRAVEYNTSAQFHLDLQRKADSAAKAVKKRAAARAPSGSNSHAPTPQPPLRAVEVQGPKINTSTNASTSSFQQGRANGHDHGSSNSQNTHTSPPAGGDNVQVLRAGGAPTWLVSAIRALMVAYPDDKFILRRINDNWRIKCHDCPGKVNMIFASLGSYFADPLDKVVHSRT